MRSNSVQHHAVARQRWPRRLVTRNDSGLRQGSYRRPRHSPILRSRTANRRGSWLNRYLLERQQHIEHLLPIARLLHVGELAAAAIGDARLGDLGRVDRVVALDVL